MVFCICLAITFLSACAPKKAAKPGIALPVKEHPFTRLAMPPQSADAIQALMQRARSEGELDMALAELEIMASEAPPPLNEEAAFRRSELLLEFQYSDALAAAVAVIEQYPGHALVPYVHMWLARWWLEREDDVRTLEQLVMVLRHDRLTRELAEEALAVGPSVAHQSPEWNAVQWFFAAADADISGRDYWLRAAANRSSMETITRLRVAGYLQGEAGEAFYLHAARTRLMTGRMDEVKQIADFIAEDASFTSAARTVRAWASGLTKPATIGVLLPLSGDYGSYGKEALRGIRMALASLQYGENISLRIEDTASDPATGVMAYRHLANEHVNIIIGPLLAENAEALLPYLKPNLPVISLTNRIDLAGGARSLFVHSLSPSAQSQFMANYAWQQGARRMAVVQGKDAGEVREAGLFIEAFEALGGEIADRLELPDADIDFRPLLREMRSRSDDEELLAELDTELDLLMAEDNMEIRMPVNFDGIYLALPGKRVALLAGQLAYVDIKDVPIYGSSHWQDDHLLDDKGRYLSSARFASISFPYGDTAAFQKTRFLYRETWGGRDEPGKLTGLAYDTLLIAAVLTSRLGLQGRDTVQGLRDPEGFPGLTGHVRFDTDGVGQKIPDV
ncbi:MAG: penicillin-binding protein activator, partial [Mariprofundaceae bacterium]